MSRGERPVLRLVGGQPSDKELVRRVRAGDQAAFAAVVRRYEQRLTAHARRTLAAGSADAEDVVQEAFARAHRALCRDERDIALCAWLHRIVRNGAIDARRRERAQARGELPAPGRCPADAAEEREALAALLAALAALPERQRDALVMRVIHGRPYTQIAHELETSLPAVKGLISRARRSLRAA